MRLIVIGGSGSIGYAVLKRAHEQSVPSIGTYNTKPSYQLIKFDLLQDSLLSRIPDLSHKDVVLVLSAISKVDKICEDPVLAYKINVETTQRIMMERFSIGARVLFLSTNQVFAGKNLDGYEEHHQRSPLNIYGEHKVLIEEYLENQTISSAWSIIRTGWNVSKRLEDSCVVKETYHALLNPNARMAFDNTLNVTDIEDTASNILEIARRNICGIYHCVNPQKITRAELADLIQKMSQYGDLMKYEKISYHSLKLSVPCPAYSYLKGEKLIKENNFQFKSIEPTIKEKVALLDANSKKLSQ